MKLNGLNTPQRIVLSVAGLNGLNQLTTPRLIVLGVAGLMLIYVLIYLLILRRPPREKPGPSLKTPAPPHVSSRLDRTLTSEPTHHSYQQQGPVAMAFAQDIGARSAQQDAVSCEADQTKAVAVVCDGMGGMADGDKASRQTISIVFQRLWEMAPNDDPEAVMRSAALGADKSVYALGEAQGKPTGVGTTLVAARIAGRKASWISVGDSRIYFRRDGQLRRLTRDHIYLMELLEMADRGEITREAAMSEPTREALTSFIGAGGPALIDTGSFELRPGDMLLLCSDGLYKSVPESDINRIIDEMPDLSDCCWMLVSEALRRGGNRQDNTTVALMRYTG